MHSPNELNIMKLSLCFQDLSLLKTSLSSKWNILYQSCFCGLFVCSFQFRTSTYVWAERISNNKSCETECFTWETQNMSDWIHENVYNFVSCEETLECSKTVFKLFITEYRCQILMSSLTSNMKVTKIGQKYFLCTFWGFWLPSYVISKLINVNMCEPHYVN